MTMLPKTRVRIKVQEGCETGLWPGVAPQISESSHPLTDALRHSFRNSKCLDGIDRFPDPTRQPFFAHLSSIMAQENSSSAVASVAIVVLVIVALIAGYFLFFRGGEAPAQPDIQIELPDLE